MKGTTRARLAAALPLAALCALLLALPSASEAQQSAPAGASRFPAAVGKHVRVTARSVNRGRRMEGEVLRVAVDTVVVDTAPDWRTHRFFGGSTVPLDSLRRIPVPIDSITRLEVENGKARARSAVRWAVRGALIGALAGGLANTPQRNPTLRDVADGAAIGFPVGAGLGALYGLFFPGDRWRTVTIPGR